MRDMRNPGGLFVALMADGLMQTVNSATGFVHQVGTGIANVTKSAAEFTGMYNPSAVIRSTAARAFVH